MLELNITKNKEKGGENNSKNKGEIIPYWKGWNCIDCDANQKLIHQDN